MPISSQYWQSVTGKWRRPSAALRYHFDNGAALAAKSRQHVCHYWAKVGPFMISHLGTLSRISKREGIIFIIYPDWNCGRIKQRKGIYLKTRCLFLFKANYFGSPLNFKLELKVKERCVRVWRTWAMKKRVVSFWCNNEIQQR